MSWRDRLQALRTAPAEKVPSCGLTKLPKPPFVSFGRMQNGPFPSEAAGIQPDPATRQERSELARLCELLFAEDGPEVVANELSQALRKPQDALRCFRLLRGPTAAPRSCHRPRSRFYGALWRCSRTARKLISQ
jgi:hypothetical protein